LPRRGTTGKPRLRGSGQQGDKVRPQQEKKMGWPDTTEDGPLIGVARAVVTDNQDPDGFGRVQVRLASEDQSSNLWVQVVKPLAASSPDPRFVPEVGDEVLVAADHGDPRLLYVLGMLRR
jgi:uncharacterized protein involved in type VI secretion and phage assembly